MEAWVIWLIAAAAAAVGEILTLSFFLGPFAVGATLAMIAELAGAGTGVALGAFAAGTGASFVLLRPIVVRHRKMPPAIRTNTDALVGRTATVVERVDADAGSIKLEGEIWTARPYDDDEVIEAGTRVQVIAIRGATALVTK